MAGELLVPLLIFAGRRARLIAFAALTGFQLVNLLTSNYGFFIHLALALHLFLLHDDDLARPRRWLARLPALLRPPVPEASPPGRPIKILTTGFAIVYLVISVLDARANFSDGGSAQRWHAWLAPYYAPLSMINTYHLFAQITRERIEPEVSASDDGARWTDYALRYKPGPLERAPPFVAPHQPRLDFQLWFYGLAAEGRPPGYILRLLVMLCREPTRAQAAFATPLLPAPAEVRLRFWRYTFSPPGSATWWDREPVGETGSLRCAELPMQ